MNPGYAHAGQEYKIEEKKLLEILGYKINDRKFSDIEKFFSEDYLRVGLSCLDNYVVYSGAEHLGNPKLPNMTFLPNLRIDSGIILGSTMGHQHTQNEQYDLRRFQEIYEFLGYGGMLIRNKDKTNFHILKSGDKMLVGTDDNMTLFNLDESPLITLDYANPEKNSANKDLENRIGSLMFIRKNTKDILFKANKRYYMQGILHGYTDSIKIENVRLGKELHEKISDYQDKFRERGIGLITGGNLPEDLRKEFSPNLLRLVLTKNKRLFDELGVEEAEG